MLTVMSTVLLVLALTQELQEILVHLMLTVMSKVQLVIRIKQMLQEQVDVTTAMMLEMTSQAVLRLLTIMTLTTEQAYTKTDMVTPLMKQSVHGVIIRVILMTQADTTQCPSETVKAAMVWNHSIASRLTLQTLVILVQS
jgi:hypothetical protein